MIILLLIGISVITVTKGSTSKVESNFSPKLPVSVIKNDLGIAEKMEELKTESTDLEPVASSTTIYVDDDNTMGPWDGTLEHPYRYIEDGVNASKNGDTVYVFNGIYHNEFFEIKRKSIQLIGEDKNTTFFTGFIVIRNVHGFTLSGFTLFPDQYYDECIAIASSSKCTISGNIFKGIGNKGTVCFEAEFLLNSVISSNTFDLLNDFSNGVISVLSYGNSITQNRFIGNPLADIGEGVNIGTSSNNNVSGNFFANLKSAFALGSMFPFTNRNNVISGNTVTNCTEGIALGTFSSNNIVTDNSLLNNEDGILLLDRADRNLIYKNNISYNGCTGILIMAQSSVNTIIANTISDNGDVGIYLPLTYPPSNDYMNKIYYNNFERNAQYNAIDCYLNLWYKPEGLFSGKGNYWDDYTGNDDNGDGIGDTPYYIVGANNKDRYPYMEPIDIENIEGIDEIINELVNEYSQESAQNEFNIQALIENAPHSYTTIHQYCTQYMINIESCLSEIDRVR